MPARNRPPWPSPRLPAGRASTAARFPLPKTPPGAGKNEDCHVMMPGKVPFEDHLAIEATLSDSQPFGPHVWSELRHRLLDFHDQRLRLMDASGVEIMIVSLNAPAIQAIENPKPAHEEAQQANEPPPRGAR